MTNQNTKTEIILEWECTDGHENSLEITFDDSLSESDIEDYTDNLVMDMEVINDNPCKTCGEVGFNEVEWSLKN